MRSLQDIKTILLHLLRISVSVANISEFYYLRGNLRIPITVHCFKAKGRGVELGKRQHGVDLQMLVLLTSNAFLAN